ncbi:hypothetical protein [Lacrimispora sp.]|uniref:hypothetical protein n=1 Tax=Lacrimispora sp. TaxID=2719234 RepID=UPI00345F3B09
MNITSWRERITERHDMAARITHLTRGNDSNEAFDNLWKILIERKIQGSTTSSGFVVGNKKAVCFQELPLTAISENLLYEDFLRKEGGKVRYSPFGLRFNKRDVFCKGGRPVIYGDTVLLKTQLPSDEHWRIVKLDLDDINNVVDWSHEREWRIPEDYVFTYNRTEVIVESDDYYKKFVNRCLSENKSDILKNINGIITLNSVYS